MGAALDAVSSPSGGADPVILTLGSPTNGGCVKFYSFHIGDYARRTGHLDLLEDLAYRRLLDLYYLQETPLDVDVEVLSRLIRMRDHKAYVRDVLREFFTETEDGWIHDRCDREISHAKDKQSKAKAAAQALSLIHI